MLFCECHASVDGTDKTQVGWVLQEHDARLLCGLVAQPGAQGGLGAGVVDEIEALVRGVGAGQHVLYA